MPFHNSPFFSFFSLSVSMNMYAHLHTSTNYLSMHVCVYIYIYIYTYLYKYVSVHLFIVIICLSSIYNSLPCLSWLGPHPNPLWRNDLQTLGIEPTVFRVSFFIVCLSCRESLCLISHPHNSGLHVWPVSYTHLTLPTSLAECRSRWSPYH